MLYTKNFISAHTVIAIWKIEEDANFFLSKIKLDENEKSTILQYPPKKQVQTLAARLLLGGLAEDGNIRVIKDDFGKPFILNNEHYISISHSEDIAVAAISKYPVGIDIQKHTEKIGRIQHKFMRTEELNTLSTEEHLAHLHIYWGAKESLFKAYGKKEVDFKAHLSLEPFELNWFWGKTLAKITKDEYQAMYQIYYEQILEEYYLVVAENIPSSKSL